MFADHLRFQVLLVLILLATNKPPESISTTPKEPWGCLTEYHRNVADELNSCFLPSLALATTGGEEWYTGLPLEGKIPAEGSRRCLSSVPEKHLKALRRRVAPTFYPLSNMVYILTGLQRGSCSEQTTKIKRRRPYFAGLLHRFLQCL